MFFKFEDQINSLLEILNYDCCWVCAVILIPVVDSCLCQERCPFCTVCPANVCSWIIPHHKKTQLFLIDPSPQFLLNKLKRLFLRLTKINMFQIKPISLAVILKNVIEWSKSHSWSFVASCPNNIVLGCKIRRKWLTCLFFDF